MGPSGDTTDGSAEDGLLAARAGRGDDDAFAALDRRHRPVLRRHCAAILRNPHDADEAAQGALIKAHRALRSGTLPRSVAAWLLTIARNESYDIIRARRAVEALPDDAEAPGCCPEERVIALERVRALRADLAELPEGQRLALSLRGFAGLSHAEIAGRIGGTEADARTLCHEARLSLAEFDEGRRLDCRAVLDRVATGDGRALRARRVRAHLRACEGCRSAAEAVRPARRAGLGALVPVLPWLAPLRTLLSGGVAGVAAKAGGAGLAGGLCAVLTASVVTGGVLLSATAPPGAAPAHARVATTSPPASAPGPTAPAAGAARATAAGVVQTRARTRTVVATRRAPATAPIAAASPATATPAPVAEGPTAPVAAPPTTPPAPGAGDGAPVPDVAVPPLPRPAVTVALPPVTVAGVTVEAPAVTLDTAPLVEVVEGVLPGLGAVPRGLLGR